MTASEYTLSNSSAHADQRLAALVAAYDPLTIAVLQRVGVDLGWRCADVGAGSGSISAWLSAQVGAQGHVLATDIDTSKLVTLDAANVEVQRSDLRTAPLPRDEFDLVHARMVLNHLAEREEVLRSLVQALRPGGWIVVAEPRHYPGPADAVGTRVGAATTAALQSRGQDVDWVWTAPRALVQAGLEKVGICCDTPVLRGGSPGADFAQRTAVQLRDQGILDVSEEDLVQWHEETQDPDRWSPQTSMISVWGRRVR